MLTAHANKDPRNWDLHLDYCVSCYNQTTQLSTKETPFFLLKGRDPLEPTDLRPPMRYRGVEDESNIFTQQWHDAIEIAKAHLIIAQDVQKQNYDGNARQCSFEIGDYILLREAKTQPGKFYMRWDGPYIIDDRISDLNYVIRKPTSSTPQTVHVNRLKLWKEKESYKQTEDVLSLPLVGPTEAAILDSEEAPPPPESKQSTDRIPESQIEPKEGSVLQLPTDNFPPPERANENTVMRSDSQRIRKEIPTVEKRRPGRPRKVKGIAEKGKLAHPPTTKNNFEEAQMTKRRPGRPRKIVANPIHDFTNKAIQTIPIYKCKNQTQTFLRQINIILDNRQEGLSGNLPSVFHRWDLSSPIFCYY